jgi:hypothetical protein
LHGIVAAVATVAAVTVYYVRRATLSGAHVKDDDAANLKSDPRCQVRNESQQVFELFIIWNGKVHSTCALEGTFEEIGSEKKRGYGRHV